MPRAATGQVTIDQRRKEPVYALRFRAYGQRRYITLGTKAEGWTQQKAETELQNVLADVRRGIWQPPTPTPVAQTPNDPTFHEFSSQWYEANNGAWRPKTCEDYAWQLSHHLLPFFKDHRLSQVTVAEVDRYRAAKVRESARLAERQEAWRVRLEQARGKAARRRLLAERPARPLAASSINKTIVTLAQIMEVAVEYEIISRNPAKGKRRKLKASKPAPVWLDHAQHIAALLNAAAELDRQAPPDRRHIRREALLSSLVYAGLRIGELIELHWADVDLSTNKITIRAAKTDAGMRRVDILPALRKVLDALKVAVQPASSDRVFPTATGGPQNPSNVRQRVLAPTLKRANEHLERAGQAPLPDGLTPHKLRHTFASILVALGVDPGAAMDQLGHTDPAFTLRVYRHGMRRDAASKQALRQLVGMTDTNTEGTAAASGSDLKASEPILKRDQRESS